MTPHFGPNFRPSLLRLEDRVVPAWWTVALPEKPEGFSGDTDAVHAGALEFHPDYAPQGGTVWVDAADPKEAVVRALAGTISVTLDGETVDYTFGPDTVGFDRSAGKPFLVTQSGGVIGIAFEDRAGFADCDWDYDDRAFPGVATSMAVTEVLHQSTHLSPQVMDESGDAYHEFSAATTVTRLESGRYKWEYTVNNLRFGPVDDDNGSHIDRFGVGFPLEVPVEDVMDDRDWFYNLSEEFGNVTMSVGWVSASNSDDLEPGESNKFSFTTPPTPIAPGGAGVDGGGSPANTSFITVVPALPQVSQTAPKFVLVNANNDNWDPTKPDKQWVM